MAATPIAFPSGTEAIVSDGVNGLTFGIMLLAQTGGHTLTPNDQVVDHVVAAELVSNGYSRRMLTGVNVGVAGGLIQVDAASVVWPAIGGVEVVSAVVIYINTGSDLTSKLVAGLDGVNAQLAGTALTVAFPAGGWSHWVPNN